MNILMLIDPRWIIEELYRPYVQKGAAWLDENESKWIDKIVPEDLNLMTTGLCICGQVFGSYGLRPDFLGEGQDFGFNHRNEPYLAFYHTIGWDLMAESFAALDRLWLDEIFWRRCVEQDI